MNDLPELVETPKEALVYIDFMATFCSDKTTAMQFRGIAKVIRSLMRRAESATLLQERHEAVVAEAGKCDVVEVLRGIRTAASMPSSDPHAEMLGQVCQRAAEEIERLRWELK